MQMRVRGGIAFLCLNRSWIPDPVMMAYRIAELNELNRLY